MMAKGPLNVIETHFEKGLLGLAVLALVGVALYYGALGPHRVEFDGERLGPEQLDERIAAKAVQLAEKLKPTTVKPDDVPNFSQQLRARFETPIFQADPNAGLALAPRLPVAVPLGAPLPTLDDAAAVREAVSLVKVLPPTRPVVATGISQVQRRPLTLDPTTPPQPGQPAQPGRRAVEAESVGLSWVTVAAYYPREALRNLMTEAKYVSYRAQVFVVSVDAQRQEMLPSGEWSDWVDVERGPGTLSVEVPAPVYDEATGSVVNQADLDRQIELVRAAQRLILQPPFYPVDSGDVWDVPPLPNLSAGARAAPPDKAAEPEPEPRPVRPPPGGRPAGPAPQQVRQELDRKVKDADQAARAGRLEEAERLAREVFDHPQATTALRNRADQVIKRVAALKRPGTRGPEDPNTLVVNPVGKDRDPAIWFHDETVVPGKTYRYRLRVKIWNRYVGKRAELRDPADANKTVLVGDWSEPSDPILVYPRTHFFVRSRAFGDEPAVSCEVFTWHSGRWLRETFSARVGDIIGETKDVRLDDGPDGRPVRETVDFSTGAVVLDLRFDEPMVLRRSQGKGEFAYAESKSIRVVYLDPSDGQVKERVDRLDRADPRYLRLREEVGVD